MSGIEPTVDTIASGEYPVSRPLFFYIKAAHLDVIPGLQEYAEFFVSEKVSRLRSGLDRHCLQNVWAVAPIEPQVYLASLIRSALPSDVQAFDPALIVIVLSRRR
jgi:hypothetical protein